MFCLVPSQCKHTGFYMDHLYFIWLATCWAGCFLVHGRRRSWQQNHIKHGKSDTFRLQLYRKYLYYFWKWLRVQLEFLKKKLKNVLKFNAILMLNTCLKCVVFSVFQCYRYSISKFIGALFLWTVLIIINTQTKIIGSTGV